MPNAECVCSLLPDLCRRNSGNLIGGRTNGNLKGRAKSMQSSKCPKNGSIQGRPIVAGSRSRSRGQVRSDLCKLRKLLNGTGSQSQRDNWMESGRRGGWSVASGMGHGATLLMMMRPRRWWAAINLNGYEPAPKCVFYALSYSRRYRYEDTQIQFISWMPWEAKCHQTCPINYTGHREICLRVQTGVKRHPSSAASNDNCANNYANSLGHFARIYALQI